MSEGIASVKNIFIRLPDERWEHIITEHSEMTDLRSEVLSCLNQPERVLAGNQGELMAVKQIKTGKYLIVVYREFEQDGFVITSFMTRRYRSLEKRSVVWSPPPST